MIDTNIYSRQIVQFFVHDKCFNNEEEACKYANELEEYNKEYFSLDDPADALIKLIDTDIIPYLPNIDKDIVHHLSDIDTGDTIFNIRRMILDRQPYEDEEHYMHLYISHLNKFSQKLKVNTIFYDLLNEYIKKYGSKELPSIQSYT